MITEVEMQCEKCKTDELLQVKVPRYSFTLLVVGYIVSVVGLLAMAGTTWWAIQQRAASAQATPSVAEKAKQDAATTLRQIDGVTPEMIADFMDDGQISTTSLERLEPDTRAEVDQVLSDYRKAMQGGASEGATGRGDGEWPLWAIDGVCLVVFIIGLVMALRKKVWRCGHCGFVAETV
jgi:hypothetical protein